MAYHDYVYNVLGKHLLNTNVLCVHHAEPRHSRIVHQWCLQHLYSKLLAYCVHLVCRQNINLCFAIPVVGSL